jgi:hypothetical protein
MKKLADRWQPVNGHAVSGEVVETLPASVAS